MLLRLLIVVLLLTAILGGIFGWKDYQQRQASSRQVQPPPATVAYTSVRASNWQPKLHAIGTLVATRGINVTAEVQGVVRKILFESGQAVSEGDVLVRLDDTVDQAKLQGLRAEQRLAGIKYHRLNKLLKERSVSLSDVDEAKAELDNSSAQVSGKRALIAKKVIKAPFGGYLGIRSVDLGEFVTPGAALVPLQTLDQLYVDFSLPERHLQSIRVGQQAQVISAAAPGHLFTGTIAAMNPGVDVATRTLKLRASLDNPDHLLRPGMFVEVDVLLPSRTQVLTLPRAAISYAPYGDSVFVIQEQDGQLSVQRQRISVGAVQGEEIEILDGLEIGQRVVLAGQVKLRNAQAVQIDNSIVPGEGALGK